MEQLKFVNSRLSEILTNNKEFKIYIDSFSREIIKKDKLYQTVILQDIGYAFITNKQDKILAVFENVNSNLGTFVAENEIIPQFKANGDLSAIDIRFPNIIKNVPSHHKNLGNLLLISLGIIMQDEYVTHHILHPSINTSTSVKAVPRSVNSSERGKFSTVTQAFDYIKTNLLKTDDLGFERFLYNIRLLANTYKKHRGIFVRNIDITESYIDLGMLTDRNIELSKH